jgi:hypothetical protein
MTSPDGLHSKAAEINAIENIVLAETKDHADWEMLGKIARQSNDSRLREVLKPAVSEVEPEEDEHLNWTKEQMARLEFAEISEREKNSSQIRGDAPSRHLWLLKNLP